MKVLLCKKQLNNKYKNEAYYKDFTNNLNNLSCFGF